MYIAGKQSANWSVVSAVAPSVPDISRSDEEVIPALWPLKDSQRKERKIPVVAVWYVLILAELHLIV